MACVEGKAPPRGDVGPVAGRGAPDAAAPQVATFSIVMDEDSQLPCRLLGLVAQQDRPVRSLALTSSRRRQRLEVELPGVDRRRAEILAEKMRGCVHVRSVRLCWR